MLPIGKLGSISPAKAPTLATRGFLPRRHDESAMQTTVRDRGEGWPQAVPPPGSYYSPDVWDLPDEHVPAEPPPKSRSRRWRNSKAARRNMPYTVSSACSANQRQPFNSRPTVPGRISCTRRT